MPGSAMPDLAALGDAMPEGAMPGSAMPDLAALGDAMPEGAMPGSAMPGSTMRRSAMPGTPTEFAEAVRQSVALRRKELLGLFSDAVVTDMRRGGQPPGGRGAELGSTACVETAKAKPPRQTPIRQVDEHTCRFLLRLPWWAIDRAGSVVEAEMRIERTEVSILGLLRDGDQKIAKIVGLRRQSFTKWFYEDEKTKTEPGASGAAEEEGSVIHFVLTLRERRRPPVEAPRRAESTRRAHVSGLAVDLLRERRRSSTGDS
mmetsp:Transcript_31642/g.100491  ORF Transcript_31642/g.100491 Transcript_31642/m.100491 type:complete len:259 (-) Transcript_31642:546-1322(-)